MSVEPTSAADEPIPAWAPTDCAGAVGCPPRCPRFVDRAGGSLLINRYDGQFERLLEFYANYPKRHRSLSLPPLTRGQVETWLERLVARGRNLVAFDGEDVVGHVAYSPRWGSDAELVVFVAAAHQNRGLGTELCRQAMAYAADDGVSSISLLVDHANGRAIHVYRSLGFDVVDHRHGSVAMRVDLTADLVRAVQAPPASRA
jgi:RimJ/RimL family protein N-acetyltransferase